MKHSKMTHDTFSVLNTDAFDRRRFREVFEMSSRLQKIREEAELPMFEHLLADIWASLYKMKPKMRAGEVDPVLIVNRLLMGRIMGEEHFVNYRRFTRLDDLSSTIGTVKIGEKLNEWLAEQKLLDADLQGEVQEIQTMQRQLQKYENPENSHGKLQTETDINDATKDLHEKLQKTMQNNTHKLSLTIEQAMQETNEVKDSIKSLLGGTRAGSGEAELRKVPLRDQISLAEKIASTNQMREIADWAGRFKQIARKKQKIKHSESLEKSGVTFGNNIEKLLPMELVLYTHPITRIDFLRRFAEGQIMQYEQKGKEILGKGPIVLCLDQSGSMYNLDTQSKGFTLALMSIARRQRRDFCLIVFSTRTQTFKYAKGKTKTSDIFNLAQTFLGGGTDFTLPLHEAVKIINESRFKQADIVFVTDGEHELEESFLEVFNKKKSEKDFKVLSLVIGNNANTVVRFSDKVVHVTDFDEAGSFTAFEM